MALELGIILAFIALFGWGFGDFFIQRAVRRLGDWEALFLITLFGAVVLTPFVYKDLPSLFSSGMGQLYILLGGSAILFFAALLDFEALKEGKISVVEPIWALEIPVAAAFAFILMGESISFLQIALVITLIAGLVLVSLKSYHLDKKIWLEKAVLIAALAALLMGAANFFIGWGSRISDALMMNWFLNTFVAIACLIYIVPRIAFKKLASDAKKSWKPVLGMCIFDNAAWIAFAWAMTLSPIAIVVALSESYIIIAVLLGVFINNEYLHKHQKLGLVIAVISAIILASIS